MSIENVQAMGEAVRAAVLLAQEEGLTQVEFGVFVSFWWGQAAAERGEAIAATALRHAAERGQS